jgi:hypothetical protein
LAGKKYKKYMVGVKKKYFEGRCPNFGWEDKF